MEIEGGTLLEYCGPCGKDRNITGNNRIEYSPGLNFMYNVADIVLPTTRA